MELLILIIVIGAVFWFLKKDKSKKLTNDSSTESSLPTPNTRPSTMNSHNVQNNTSNTTNSTPIINADSDSDGFANFTFSYGKSELKSTNQIIGRWVGENESLSIQGRTLPHGFYYFGGQLNMLTGYGTEPSLIDDSLPTEPPSHTTKDSSIPYSDHSLGYWPSYSSLSISCRGIYLDWLSSNRSNPHMPIGYVFIYFAGFERRIIENVKNEVVSDTEFVSIFKEVSRLNKVYSSQSSFRVYSSNLLEYMMLIRPTLFEKDAAFKIVLPDFSRRSNLRFKYNLANKVALGSSIPALLAWQWLQYSDEYNFKTPAKRCEDEFKKLFIILYNQNYPNGFTVTPNETKLKISYHSASSSVGSTELDINDLPDPSILKAPVQKLIVIAERCNESLDAYSRYIGKDDTSKNDIAAVLLLPKPLIEQLNPLVIEKFISWVQPIITTNKGLTTTKELWSHIGEPLPKSLTKKHNELIVNLVELAGFGVAPDLRYHQTRLKPDDSIVLFESGHGDNFTPSSSFYQISLALRLGAMVATIDGHVDEHEVNALMKLINQDSTLCNIEKTSLAAYLTWRLNSPANVAGIKAKIEKIDDEHITFISRFIISIALANGAIELSQIKQIEKLYGTLGLDKSRVSSDIHSLTSSKKGAINLNDVRDVKTNTGNNNTNTNTDKNTAQKPFSLDADILALHESETGDAKAMLASIFASDEEVEDDIEREAEEKVEINQVAIDSLSPDTDTIEIAIATNGLDAPHSQLYLQLIIQEAWQCEEVEALCKPLNLMINGAIETINDWAFDSVDAPVIDEADEILVDLEIVEELRTLNK